MAEIKWIKIVTGLFSDEKIMLIEQMPDADTILVIWFKILCMAGRENNNGVFVMAGTRMAYTEEMLAAIFRRPINTVRMALNVFEAYGMIEIQDGVISVTNWDKHQNIDGMEKIREKNRLRKQKQREQQKLIASRDSHTLSRDSHATDKEEDKEKDKEKNIKTMCKEEACTLFESLWKLYPLKRGKGQVSESKKRQLLDIGYEQMERAINRYKADLERDTWRKPQNGSTFFNTGYVDYLDDNYVQPSPNKTKGQLAEQRNYDFDLLEKELLEN